MTRMSTVKRKFKQEVYPYIIDILGRIKFYRALSPGRFLKLKTSKNLIFKICGFGVMATKLS